jgi:chromosome segregation ATPase
MDIQQALRLIEWLDEERRKDRQTISMLEERLHSQQDTLDSLLRRVNGMESDQSMMRSELAPSALTNDSVEQLRREMRQMIETVEAKRLNAEREAVRVSEIQREQLLRTLREVEEKTERIGRQTMELYGFQTDRDRFSGTISDLQLKLDDLNKRFDDPERRIVYLEEQRRQDARRITELETQLQESRRNLDSIRPKISLIEDLSIRNERRIQDIATSDRDRREQIQQFIDQQTLLNQTRDQEISNIVRRFEEHDRAMEQNIQRFESWSEAYRAMRQIIEDFHRIGERLERRINEVAEMQRLSEDRFRQEWNTYRTEDQKRWQNYTLSSDEVWRKHDNEFVEYVKILQAIQNELPIIQGGINRLWQMERDRAAIEAERARTLLQQIDPTGTTTSGPTSTSTSSFPIVRPNGSGNP